MDTITAKQSGANKLRPAVVEALLAEVAALDEAAVQERMLPAGCYTAPEFFAFEQAEVFCPHLDLRRPGRAGGRARAIAGDGSRRRAGAGGARRGRHHPGAERRLPAPRRDHSLPGKRQGASAARCTSGHTISRPAGRRAAHGRRRGGPAAAPDGAAAGAAARTVARLHLRQSRPEAPPLGAQPRQARTAVAGRRGDRAKGRAAGA